MKLSAYIQMLQGTLDTHGDAEVAMTQEGYYADGKFADLFEHIGTPSKVVETVYKDPGKWEDTTWEGYILGHSYQSY